MSGWCADGFLQFIIDFMEIGFYVILLLRLFLVDVGYCYSICVCVSCVLC